MAIPNSLPDWRYETVVEIVEQHEFEPARFDYKEALNPTAEGNERRVEHLASVRRTVCAMANTGGGFILFGIRDRRQNVAVPMDRIVGVPRRGDHLREFGNKLSAIQPEIHFEATPGLLTAARDSEVGIFVVYIPESDRRPHMVIPPSVFYRRGDGGAAVEMDYYEVREQMIYGEDRRRKVLLLMAKIAQYCRLAEQLEKQSRAAHSFFDRFNATLFDSLLVDVWGRLPTDWLLQRLMSISETAHRIDNVLDLAATAASDGSQRGAMNNEPFLLESDARQIVWQGRECLQRLEQMFGPLPQSLRQGIL